MWSPYRTIMNEWVNLLLYLYTWSHRVKLRDDVIRDIFLINASFTLFTFNNYVRHWFLPTFWFWSTAFQVGNNKKLLFISAIFFKFSSQQKSRPNRLSVVSRETLPLMNNSCDFQGWAVKCRCNTAQRREGTASQQTIFTPVFVVIILVLPLENC